MTRFEEDIVECYYNLQGYFTIKNIPFPAVEKRPGGKGRGEIDLLAVRIGEDRKIADAVRVEVGVSISSKFPFCSKKKDIDEVSRVLKKFFESDADYAIPRYFHNTNYRNVCVTSDFYNKIEEKLRERFSFWKATVINLARNGKRIIAKIRHNNTDKEIEFTQFSEIIEELREIFKSKRLMTKDFQDPRLRAIQYLVKGE